MKLSLHRYLTLFFSFNAFLINMQVTSAQVAESTFCNNQNTEGYQRIEENGVGREYILYPSTLESPDWSRHILTDLLNGS